jgi:hypothetical protein
VDYAPEILEMTFFYNPNTCLSILGAVLLVGILETFQIIMNHN